MTLRSPRESLGGYIILPRLIDKVRLHAKRQLPEAYKANLLGDEPTLDGRLLAFTGLDGTALRDIILRSHTDDEVLLWVQGHARPVSPEEQERWATEVARYHPDSALVEYRRHAYPHLAAQIDLSTVSVFDLIDMDEGRLSVSRFVTPQF
jgi:hypothetical protein